MFKIKSSIRRRLPEEIKVIDETLKEDRQDFINAFGKDKAITVSSLNLVFSAFKSNLGNPIFIIGAPRSGTTFLGNCISHLPDLSYHFEPVATKRAARAVYEESWSFSKGKRYYKLIYALLMAHRRESKLRFVEKTPRNCFIIDFLASAFPGSKFIHIVRDGRDAALSLSKKPWLQGGKVNSGKYEPGGYQFGPYARFWVEKERVQEFESTSDIHRCIWSWRRHTSQALASLSKVPKERQHQIRYESFVENPAVEADQLLSFLKLSNTQHQNHFLKMISQAHTGSVGLWKDEFSQDQLNEIYQEAGDLLSSLEYV